MKTMNRFLLTTMTLLALTLSSCNEWLNILPNNEQVTDNYWKTRQDVEAVVASGYYYMRQAVPTMLVWGEVRGGALYSSNSQHSYLQNFNLTPSSGICDYASLYKVIGMANCVEIRALGNNRRRNLLRKCDEIAFVRSILPTCLLLFGFG